MHMFKYITNTRVASQLNLEKEMKIVVSYLIANRTVIADPEDLTSIFSTRSFASTPISEIFEKCIVGRHLGEFATIADPSSATVSGIPDVLTMPSLVIDLLQSPAGEALSGYRELYRKLVMNITNLVKRTNAGLQVSALHELHSMYVKALLVRSYYSSDRSPWLSPVMQQFVIRTYSLFISTIIARNTGLNYTEQNVISGIFALYMCQMLAGENRDLVTPPQFLNINYLGTRADLMSLAEECSEYSKDGLTIEKCCKLVTLLGPSRAKDYNVNLFYRHCSSLGVYNDTISTYLSFDYPPYWVWLILLSLSGVKLGTMNKMLQMYNLKQAGMKFAVDLMSYQSLIER